jgi:hypothetical protein
VEATLLLANSAEAGPNGTVSALGIGWSITGTPTPPIALVLLIKVPWDQTNVKHRLTLKLVDSDGHDVMLGQTQLGGDPAPLLIDGEFEVGRPPGLPHGTPIDQAMPITIGPGLPLIPGRGYQWRLEIDGDAVASRSFLVRAEVAA